MPEKKEELTEREQELAAEVQAAKESLRKSDRQVAMVMDLNKCIGCQTCSMACKSLWTRKPGRDYMWWNTVNTVPSGFNAFRRIVFRSPLITSSKLNFQTSPNSFRVGSFPRTGSLTLPPNKTLYPPPPSLSQSLGVPLPGTVFTVFHHM